jgi:superfamily II DNA or RNA helicase
MGIWTFDKCKKPNLIYHTTKTSKEVLVVCYRKRSEMKIQLRILGNRVKVSSPTSFIDKSIFQLIDSVSSFYVANYIYTTKFKEGKWDGRRRLFDRRNFTFPLGLLNDVIEKLEEEFIEYEVTDLQSITEDWRSLFQESRVEWLREYQKKAVRDIITQERCILKAPSGSGKTEVAIGLVHSISPPGEPIPTLFLTHRRDLARQTVERFCERIGEKFVGLYGMGSRELKEITIGVVPSVANNLRNLSSFLNQRKILISDECHRASSSNWFKVSMGCSALLRLGMSATPVGRTDGADLLLRAAYGGEVIEILEEDLLAGGYLAIPKSSFHKVSIPAINIGLVNFGDFHSIYHYGISHNDYRNGKILQIVEESLKEKSMILIVVRLIEHGEIISRLLKENLGFEVPFIHGSLSNNDRTAILESYRRREFPVLVASTVFEEGIDLDCDCVVNASGGKSLIRTLQIFGRGMRPGKNKQMEYHDFLDFGHPTLNSHSETRRKSLDDRFSIQSEILEN